MDGSIALLLLVILVALIGALRWDALRAGLMAMLSPDDQTVPPPVQQLSVPRHLHDEHLNQSLHHKPAIHRSGRRG